MKNTCRYYIKMISQRWCTLLASNSHITSSCFAYSILIELIMISTWLIWYKLGSCLSRLTEQTAMLKYSMQREWAVWHLVYIFSFIKTETNDDLESSSENQKRASIYSRDGRRSEGERGRWLRTETNDRRQTVTSELQRLVQSRLIKSSKQRLSIKKRALCLRL